MLPPHGSGSDKRVGKEEILFLKRWLAHPLKVGSVLPSSPALGKLVARNTSCGPDQAVVELGAGTGSITKALLRAGIPPERLFLVEIDRDMAAFLRREFPGLTVIEGDAGRLPELLPPEWRGRIGTVISGIPMITLPIEIQQRIIDAGFAVMAPGGQMLQYTYSLVSPWPERKLRVKGRRCGLAVANVPPAWVWSYGRVQPAARAA